MDLFKTSILIRHYNASNFYLCIVKVAGVVLHILINNPVVALIRHLRSQLQSLQIRLGAFLFSPYSFSYEFSTPGAGAGRHFNNKNGDILNRRPSKILSFPPIHKIFYACPGCGRFIEYPSRCPYHR